MKKILIFFIVFNFYSNDGHADSGDVDCINMLLQKIYSGEITTKEDDKIKKYNNLIVQKKLCLEELGNEIVILSQKFQTLLKTMPNKPTLEFLLSLQEQVILLNQTFETKDNEYKALNDSFDQLVEEFIKTLNSIKNRQENESKKEMDSSLDNIPGKFE